MSGSKAQSVARPTAYPGDALESHLGFITFVEIDHEIISAVFLSGGGGWGWGKEGVG